VSKDLSRGKRGTHYHSYRFGARPMDFFCYCMAFEYGAQPCSFVFRGIPVGFGLALLTEFHVPGSVMTWLWASLIFYQNNVQLLITSQTLLFDVKRHKLPSTYTDLPLGMTLARLMYSVVKIP